MRADPTLGCTSRALILLLAAGGIACLDSSATITDDPIVADRQRIEAMASADPVLLDRLLHEKLSYSHSNGRVDSKPELIDGLVSGRVDYVSIELQNPVARQRGEVAIVTAPVQMEVVAAGQTHALSSIYTAVYWFEDRRWQLVAYHSSAVAPR